MTIASEVIGLDGLAQAALIRDGEITAVELIEATIAAIEATNDAVNAVVTKTYDLAREAAEKPLDGPFAGVPYLLKDIYGFHVGVPQANGSNAWGDYLPSEDSELVIRHRNAGLIPIGKSASPEFGLEWLTETQRFGVTRNPWDVDLTPGGSSGGAAAAVAAGMVPIAHANDGAGSTRIPASCCGLFGLKPTRSRNPLRPQFSDLMAPVVSESAVTRSVRDSAVLLDATAGAEIGAPYVAPPPPRPFAEEVTSDPLPLRIAISTTPFTGARVHQDCVEAASEAAELCRELGHEVEEATPAVDGSAAQEALALLWLLFGATSVEAIERTREIAATEETVGPWAWMLHEHGKSIRAVDHIWALQTFQEISYVFGEFFETYDVLLTPTIAVPPVRTESMPFDYGDDPRLQFEKNWWQSIPFTPLVNVTGQPAMSVPLHWSSEGIPIGVQFVGRFGDESTLFALAGQLERARPWADRRPPVFAGARQPNARW